MSKTEIIILAAREHHVGSTMPDGHWYIRACRARRRHSRPALIRATQNFSSLS